MRCRLNISKQTCPPGSPGILQSLSVTGYGWHTWPSILNCLAQGLGYPSPRGFSLYNSDILATFPFWTFGLLTPSPLLPPPSTSFPLPHGPIQPAHVLSVFSQMSLSLPMLFLLSTKTSSSTIPRSNHVLSFPFYFFFFHSDITRLRFIYILQAY